MLFDRVGMDKVIQFRQQPLPLPFKPFGLLGLQPLEFLDDVELYLRGNPRSVFKGDVAVSERAAAILAGFGSESNCVGSLSPFRWSHYLFVPKYQDIQ